MKKLLVILLAAWSGISNAQVTLVGMSPKGGFNNHGTIFTVNSTGNIETLFNFNEGVNGCSPTGGLVQDSDGTVYGMTASCGSNNMGTLFKFEAKFHGVTKLVDFTSSLGACPTGTPIMASDGNLYGMTNTGGTNDAGTIFKCTPDGQVTILVSFNHTNGAYPLGSLKEGKDGNFYGMTRLGGEFEQGEVFKYSPFGILTVLHSFTGDDGSQPQGNITIVKDSILYGLTYMGGTEGSGVIFSCSTSGKYALLNSFGGNTGVQPAGSLLYTGDGYLYGTTANGGVSGFGTLFRCNDSGKIAVLVNFNDTNGANPSGTLTYASDGNIYGVTKKGGVSADAGVVFRYNTTSAILESIYEFGGSSSQIAQGGLIELNRNFNSSEFASNKRLRKASSHKDSRN